MKIITSKIFLPLFLLLFFNKTNGQQIVDIRFNLYADSVKTTIDNYINVEALLSNGRYIPLTDKEINFVSESGKWKGNCLIINKKDTVDKIKITAILKANPQLKKSTFVYVQKHDDVGVYMIEQDYTDRLRKRRTRSRRL